MSPVAVVQLVGAVVAAAVDVHEEDDYTRVTFLKIPVFDTRWRGVKRRQARRAARRGEKKASMVDLAKRTVDGYHEGRKK
jgi:hypothetical protein